MSEEYSSEQVDQMYAEAMGESSPSPVTEEAPAPEQQSAEEMLFDIKWGGETKQLPKDKVVSYAQQGYDYSQKMQQFNHQRRELEQKQAAWEAQQKEFQSKYDNLAKIDEYARQNPQWLQTVQQQYQEALSTGQQPINDAEAQNPLLSQFQEKLSGIEQQLQERAKLEEQERIAKEDAALDNEILQYKQKYEGFQWDKPDEITGLNLEQQILQHAQDHGINNFRAAANDYLHDKLIAQAEERAKESLATGIQKDKSLGLGAPTTKSSLLAKPAANVTQKSYEALVQEAMNDLNI